MGERQRRVARWGGALLGAGLLALVWWAPWRAPGDGGPGSAAVAYAATSVITGTVAWKGTDTPVNGVQIVLRDEAQGTVVAQTTTDAAGTYMLQPGVGSWLVDVPSTDQYWGYAQTVVILPHDFHELDFGITVRPPAPPTPTAGPTQTPAPQATPGGSPVAQATPPTHLPPSGRPAADDLAGRLVGLAGLLVALGAAGRLGRRTGKGLR